jgi:cell wall-associated NlpC family hydrolase
MELAGRRGAVTPTRRPAPGDLVFLADAPGGAVSHVALVARAEPDGTFLAVHRVERGVRRVRMNLSYPERATDPATGKLINDTLLVRKNALPAGSLVVAVSDLLRRG